MRLLLLEKNRIIKTNLPKNIAGNYWIINETKENLINVEANNNKWFIKSNRDFKLVLNEEDNELSTFFSEIEIEANKMYYIIDIKNDTKYKLYCEDTYDSGFIQYKFSFNNLNEITIGNNSKKSLQDSDKNDINCNIQTFSKNQIKITIDEDICYIKNLNNKINMYINDIVYEEKKLINGEIVFIEGIKFGFFGEFLLINNQKNIEMDLQKFFKREIPTMKEYNFSNLKEEYIEFFKKDDYFQRPPRFNRIIEEKEIKIEEAPSSQIDEEIPMIFTLGTMLTMGATSMLTGISAITKIISGETTVKEQTSSLITCGIMLIGMVFFPFFRTLYMKQRKQKKEMKRKQRYREYLKEKKEEIINEMNYQREVLLENNISPIDCEKIILNKERNLWERKIEQLDFLNVRIGLGKITPKININSPEEHFVLEKDILIDEMHKTLEEVKDMEHVPIILNLNKRNCSGLIGEYSFASQVLENIMIELLTLHSYDNLKIVIFTNEKRKSYWKKYQNVPHFWNNEKSLRFFGNNYNDIMEISNYLTEIYNNRQQTLAENDKVIFKPYYLIVTDAIETLDNVGIISSIINNESNLGFGLLINSNNIDSLPNECNLFVNLAEGSCAIYEQINNANNQTSFTHDIAIKNIDKSLMALCNIPVDTADGKFILPERLGFLEMYDVGNVNQLNSINRWKENNITTSLEAPIGINEQGEIFKLDIHEKYHGPHGLVAGMTGSGKSEWLITYILSMAINYHPDEVQFVLIDYKGGGLAGVFENREKGFKLPHLAGTITNLDVVEINRALASIQSELKRRQSLFNSARDSLNESTIDIYKYQRLYREGKVSEPMSHLIIISDEFAELKSQQPEFMGELISTARIGRSLGVHLILATQKPSGVVDDQIWSNAKFRACLKVQEKADSNDMIKKPDAAMIKEPGRFFLQVGYNEFFAKGQGAYAGGPYFESDKRKDEIDTSLEFISDIGYCYKTIEAKRNIEEKIQKGEELSAVLNYINDTANKVDLHVHQLWLNRIPDIIFHDNLKRKYQFQKEDFILNPIIGEYDAPEIQKQGLVTLPLTKEGNAIIYGISGSGKENLLINLMYSFITIYSVKEINIYILDFGSETLIAYQSAPQVGDILRDGDEEKIANLFKMLRKSLEQRKELFQDYNGDIYTYSKNSSKSVPNLIVIINNFENFQELYPNYQEELISLTRDGFKYGIIFIITTNGTNNVRLKLTQNFSNVLTLQLKDKFEYAGVFGNVGNTIPSKVKGRGLVKLNKVYEFQTAYVIEELKQIEYIKSVCQKLKESTTERAQKIPILPKIVDFEFIDDFISDVTQVPIGVLKDSLEIAKFDLLTKDGTLIISQDTEYLESFAKSLFYILEKINNLNVFIIDSNKFINIISNKIKIFNNDFDRIILELDKFINAINDTNVNNYNDSLFIFMNPNSLLEKLSIDNKKILGNILNKISSISKFNFVFIEKVSEIKKLEYETWYKNVVNTSRGIFLGTGIENQFSIKLSKLPREEIPEDFGYVIVRGKAFVIKPINFKVGENNEK